MRVQCQATNSIIAQIPRPTQLSHALGAPDSVPIPAGGYRSPLAGKSPNAVSSFFSSTAFSYSGTVKGFLLSGKPAAGATVPARLDNARLSRFSHTNVTAHARPGPRI